MSALLPAQRIPGLLVALLGLGLAVGVVGALAVAVLAPEWTWVPPALGVGALLAWFGARGWERHLRHPLAPLAGVFVLASLSLYRSAGITPVEAVFALYLYPYLAVWYGLRVFVYRERLVRTVQDAAMAIVIAYPFAALVLTVLFRGSIALAVSDLIAFSMFALYFPFREACARYERGIVLLVGGLLLFACVTFVRNLLALQAAIATASAAWEIARVRVTSNEMALMLGSVFCAGLAAQARSWRTTGLYAIGFAALAVGLVLTQWRAYYVSFAIAIVLVMVLLRGRARMRLMLLTGLGGLGASLLVFLLFGDSVILFAYGILDRLLSIGTATTVDVSLLNRFLESRAVLERIWESPILGHGPGVQFGFHDITSGGLWIKPYAHNGFLTIAFKYGLVLLTVFLFSWGRALLDSYQAGRSAVLSRSERTIGLVICASLIALIPSFAVSAPLTTGDTVLCFTLLLAMSSGLRSRANRRPGDRQPAQEAS